jgi:four helix bundle protein
MRESNYWLRIISSIESGPENQNELNDLIKESEELKKILGSIVTKTK